MQVETERGRISVDDYCSSAAEAKEKGYSYAFTSHLIGYDAYSKCLDEKGYRHTFLLVKRNKNEQI